MKESGQSQQKRPLKVACLRYTGHKRNVQANPKPDYSHGASLDGALW
jgi:hypothetical protein